MNYTCTIDARASEIQKMQRSPYFVKTELFLRYRNPMTVRLVRVLSE